MNDRTIADHLQNREVVVRGVINDEASPPKVLELITFLDFTQRGQTMWPGIARVEFTDDKPELTELITPPDIKIECPYDFLREWEDGWLGRNISFSISEDPVVVIKRVGPLGDIPFIDGFEELSELNLELLELLDKVHSVLRHKLATTDDDLQQQVLTCLCDRLLGLIKQRKIKRERALEKLG